MAKCLVLSASIAHLDGFTDRDYGAVTKQEVILRKTSVAVAFAIALVCAMFAGGRSSSASPVTATPTPVPHANITIRHTLDGVPFIVDSDRPATAYVGDSSCGFLHVPEFSAERIVDIVKWPWTGCSTANEPIRICVVSPTTQGQFCTNPFLFTGDDVAVDLAWPASAWQQLPKVTAHFVRDGQPVPVTILGWWFATGDAICDAHIAPTHTSPPVVTTAVVASALSVPQDTPVSVCGQAGTKRVARFTTQEFGDVEGTFDFAGNDVTFDVDVGPSATATPTPLAQVSSSPMPPTPSPASLPPAGGQPDTNGVPIAALAGSLVALAGGAILASAWTGRKRRA
jgi:hypothetical protein